MPEDQIVFKTKDQLALEMVGHAQELGLGFCIELEKMKETFMVDIHSDQRIYKNKPTPCLPDPKGRGKKTTLYKIGQKGVRVDKWVAAQPNKSWPSA